jgi:hypothetical protein
MVKRHYPIVLILIALLIATLACSLGGKKDVPLGETFRSETGGFTLQKVPDYEFEEFWGMVIMMPADAQQDVGPFIMAYGELTEENISLQDVLSEMQGEAEGAQFSDPKQTKVDGIDGLLVEFSGEEAGQALQGKMFVAVPFPEQEFYITALAPEARWKELEPVFDAVLKSVTFFKAEPFDFGAEDWDWDNPVEETEEAWEMPVGDSTLLGELYQHIDGGFSFRKVAGYDFWENFGIITMIKPGRAALTGPAFTIIYQVLETPMSTEDVLNMAISDPNATYQAPENYMLDGIWGLLVDFERTDNGQTARGRTYISMITPNEYFTVDVISPEEDWSEMGPMFDALLASFDFSGEAAAPATAPGQVIRQWAVRAEASSEYSSDDYSAMQATGAPDVDVCEENPLAWASQAGDTEEYLVLHYETPVNPTELVIYQSHNPSQVVEIQFIDTTGETWMLWYGDPKEVSSCPDVWTHTIELDEVFYTDTVVIWVDQSVLGLGWVEIDAVELVGYPQGAAQDGLVAPVVEEPPAQVPVGDVPTNYSGKMAGPVYQGWINIIIGETMEADLDRIMTIAGRKSTDSWKPRESHKQTYLFDMPWADMTAYISVDTDGVVYRKNVSATIHADDYALSTVTWDNYEILKAIYDRDKVIPYEVMANLLESPGFLREVYYREDDGKIVSTYSWYNAAGDRISGIFFDGKLTGIAGLAYIAAD